jgi:hypothetical protein
VERQTLPLYHFHAIRDLRNTRAEYYQGAIRLQGLPNYLQMFLWTRQI